MNPYADPAFIAAAILGLSAFCVLVAVGGVLLFIRLHVPRRSIRLIPPSDLDR